MSVIDSITAIHSLFLVMKDSPEPIPVREIHSQFVRYVAKRYDCVNVFKHADIVMYLAQLVKEKKVANIRYFKPQISVDVEKWTLKYDKAYAENTINFYYVPLEYRWRFWLEKLHTKAN